MWLFFEGRRYGHVFSFRVLYGASKLLAESIFLFLGAMGMVFIQKGGGIFAKLTIRSAADQLVQSPLPQAPTVQQLQALLKDL